MSRIFSKPRDIGLIPLILSACIMIIFVLTTGCGMQPSNLFPPKKDSPIISIYLINHGLHAGIATPQNQIPQTLWPRLAGFDNKKFLEIGWGDRKYYTATDPGLTSAMRAVLLPTSSVLHLAEFDSRPEAFFPNQEIIMIELSVKGFEKMMGFIAKSFARDPAGQVIVLGPGLYGNSRFYASKETYHLCKTCNTWTANALRAGGCPVGSPVTVGGLMKKAGTFGKVMQSRISM